MKLWDTYELLHDDFSIIAFHDAKVKNFEELDEKLESIIEEHWGGRELPFPILLDATGQTLRDYDIHTFPTLLLIDPDGKLVKGRAEKNARRDPVEDGQGARAEDRRGRRRALTANGHR